MVKTSGLIKTLEGLPPWVRGSVSAEEAGYLAKLSEGGDLPFGVTPHFASLAGTTQDDPIRRQFFPDSRESAEDPFALADPLGHGLYQAAPRLVHQYQDRALLLAGGRCAGYCRYCFRRSWIARPRGFISPEELPPVLGYLSGHTEIRELLISGGDPVTASDERLDWLFRELRSSRPGLLLRLCTRCPVTEPGRVTPDLIRLLASYRPLRIAVHLNHSRELAEPAARVLEALVSGGLPVHVQTVLLKGVNDRAEILGALFRDCLDLGLSPYYLFQLDLAPGTAHFRTPLKQGLGVYEELKTCISGLGLPKYAVDLPGGGGKILLHEGVIAGMQEDQRGAFYLLKDRNGTCWPYPVL